MAQSRTVVGQWLVATAVGHDEELRGRLTKALNGGRPGFNPDEPAVVAEFCALALCQGVAIGGREQVVRMADEFVQHPAMRGKHADDDVRRMILAGLGEEPAPSLTPGQEFLLQASLAAFVLLKMHTNETAIEDLVRQAEDHAFAAGFSPPLVDETD